MTAIGNILDSRAKSLPGFSYKLNENQYGLDYAIPDTFENAFDLNRMSMVFPFASGVRRDGVGDLLEVGGIRTDRHRLNPLVLLDHGKGKEEWAGWAIAKAEDPDTKEYTVNIDPVAQTATVKAFFYQGKGLKGVEREKEKDFAYFCEQLYDLAVQKYIRAGSIGYTVIKALPLQADRENGTPQGMHLLVTLMLEASLVWLPANQDTVLKVLSLPTVCGKSLSPMLRQHLECHCEGRKAQLGYEAKEVVPVPLRKLPKDKIPPPEWEAGAGAKSVPPDVMGFSFDVRKFGPKEAKEWLVSHGYSEATKWRSGVQQSRLFYSRATGQPNIQKENAEDGIEVLRLKSMPSDNVSPEKARQILKDGEANGKPLTDKQRGMFGAAAGKAIKDIRRKYRTKDSQNEGVRSRTGKTPALTYGFKVGDKVTARTYIFQGPSTQMNTFASPGERVRIVEMEGNGFATIENSKGQRHRTLLSTLRKHLEQETQTKSLSSLRKKYRTAKGLRRRLKRSSPGAAILHMDGKDVDAARALAEQKGLQFKRIGSHDNGIERVKLIGDDDAIDAVAKEYGKMVKSLSNGKVKASWSGPLKQYASQLFRRFAPGGTGVSIGLSRDDDGVTVGSGDPTTRQAFPRMLQQAKQDGYRAEIDASGDLTIYPKKSLTKKGKAMDDVTPGNEAALEEAEPEVKDAGSAEPWGAQMLRRFHEDHSLLMKDYDEMLPMLEHEPTKSFITKHMGNMEKALTEAEGLFAKHYKQLPGLAGAMEEEEGVKDDEELEEKDADVDLADSEPEEDAPSGAEAWDGMQTKDDEMTEEEQKSLRIKYRRKRLSKSACPECGKEGCTCGKSAKTKDMDGEEAIEATDDLADVQNPGEKELQPHEMAAVKSCHAFTKELSEERNFGDEHRMKAYYHHKTLEPIANGDEGNVGGMDDGYGKDLSARYIKKKKASQRGKLDDADSDQIDAAMANMREQGTLRKKDMDPNVLASGGDDDVILDNTYESGGKSMRAYAKALSGFMKELSQEKAFGDAHREKALTFHKDGEPLLNQSPSVPDQPEELDLEDEVGTAAMDEEEMETKSEEEMEPGECGEKKNTLKLSKAKALENARKEADQIHAVALRLNKLVSRLG